MEEFDLDKYLRASKRVDLSGVTWERVRSHPVSESEARCLAYMMDIETHTSIYLRDLLATPAAYEPDVTAFLSCWVYEELWHGEAFSRFLGEAGWSLAPDREAVNGDSPYPTRVGRNSWIRRAVGGTGYLAHVTTIAASLVLRDFVAVHMTWGAINEWSTYAGYRQLIDREQHPTLTELITRIMRQETRHVAFYVTQARERLARSRKAQRLTRFALRRFWGPVGSTVMPTAETGHLLRFLFGDESGRKAIRKIDTDIDGLPGLGGLTLVHRAAVRYGITG
jgi:hypothetical protein